MLITALCPESPKWLLLQGQTKEAIDALNYIAWFNRSKVRIAANTQFVEAMVSDNLEHTHTLDHETTVSRVFTELSYRATRWVPPRHPVDKPKKNSQLLDFLLVGVLFMIAQSSYAAISLMLGTLDGNKYVNGMLFSLAGAAGGMLSGVAMAYSKETTVYRLCALSAAVCNAAFYQAEDPTLKYVFLSITVFGLAGAFNSVFVVMELRTPPENLGSASVLTYVIGALGCAATPSVGAMQDPTRTLVVSGLVVAGLAWTWLLPAPGKYLPKAVKLTENVTLL